MRNYIEDTSVEVEINVIKDKLKIFLRSKLDYKIYENILIKYGFIINRWQKIKYRQRVVHNGSENQDKTFYVVRVLGRAAFFQYYYMVLTHILYADRKGWIPVVDLTSSDISYRANNENNFATVNVWEQYFEQPQRVTLKEIEKSRNIVLSKISRKEKEVELIQLAIDGNHESLEIASKSIQKNLQYNQNTLLYLKTQYEKIIGDKKAKNILGVHIRGTDYIALEPKGYAIQPNVEYIINKTNELVKIWNIDLIYVCTEDSKMLNSFKEGIGVEVVHTDCMRLNEYKTKSTDIMEQLVGRQTKKDPYLSGLEYLADIHLLSKCDYLLSGKGLMGTNCGMLMNGGKFRDKYIIDLGEYI